MNKTFTVSACVTVWLTVISGSRKWGRVGTDFTASGKPSQCVCVYSIYGSCAEAPGQTALQCVMCPKRLRAHVCACNDNDFVHADEPECHRFLERHISSERGRSGAVLWLLFFSGSNIRTHITLPKLKVAAVVKCWQAMNLKHIYLIYNKSTLLQPLHFQNVTFSFSQTS